MIEFIILGMLQISKLTMYDIKRALENYISHFYSTSTGSIHPALKKLEKNEMVIAEQTVENGRAKKIYTITDEGRSHFSTWLQNPIPLGRVKEDALAKLFFFGFLQDNNRKESLGLYIKDLEEQIKVLSVINEETKKKEIPDEFREIAFFQKVTLDFGLKYHQFVKEWCCDLLEKL